MDNLKTRVLEALENAEENGYKPILLMMLPKQVAIDLCDLVKEFEGMNPDDLLPIVIEWQERN